MLLLQRLQLLHLTSHSIYLKNPEVQAWEKLQQLLYVLLPYFKYCLCELEKIPQNPTKTDKVTSSRCDFSYDLNSPHALNSEENQFALLPWTWCNRLPESTAELAVWGLWETASYIYIRNEEQKCALIILGEGNGCVWYLISVWVERMELGI